jgi:putative drug exporter of the RND superfamily
MPPSMTSQRSRNIPRDRLAVALRRLRWPVLVAWLLLIVLLHPLAASLSKVTNDSVSAYLPSAAPSTRVALIQQGGTGGAGQPQTDQAVVVLASAHGLTAGDLARAGAARAAVGALTGHVSGLGRAGPLRRSADGQAVTFTTSVTASAQDQESADTGAVRAIRSAVAHAASRAAPGLQDAVTGSAAITADSNGESQNTLLLTALVIVALILLLVYRSPLLWILPLLGALGAIVMAQAGAYGLASAGLTVSSLSTSILIVLVFGAASDYALLLTHRYREELSRHATTEEAMAVALRATLPTLAASAATVTCAMLCLLAAQSASLHGLGPVGAVGIVCALLAQVTFLPALLLVVGRAAFWPRVPRPGRAVRDESRIWAGIGARVARRPALVTVAAVLLLGAACAGLAALHSANDPLDNVKGHPGSVTGAHLLTAHYPAGDFAPLTLLAPPGEAAAAAATARSTPGVNTVVAGAPAEGYDSFSVAMTFSPYGARGTTLITDLRARLDHTAPRALVGGDPAIRYDIARAAHHDTMLLIPLVLAVILVIVMLLLRAVAAPLVLVATTALSFGASFGLSSLLWQHVLGYAGIESQLPLYIFIFLVALGVDYNIFLSARIREESRRLGPRRGTLRGLGVTGGVITAAGVVLAGTFAALAQLPQVDITEVGTAVALGVLLDTLLVRTVLVPAALLTLGDRVWWPSRQPERMG